MIQIQKAVGSSPLLRNKSELIEEFVRRYAMDREVSQQWASDLDARGRPGPDILNAFRAALEKAD